MLRFRQVVKASFPALILAGAVYGQQVISVHSGVIHYTEGRVFVDGNAFDQKPNQFPTLKANQELSTEDGRAEILLTPGAFLRVAENSSVRMILNELSNTKVEVLGGSAMLECTQLPKDNAISLVYQNTSIQIEKPGLYRVDSDPPRFRVFEGEAQVSSDSKTLQLKGGKETLLTGTLATNKFDTKDNDDLYRWSGRRSGYVAMANVSAAKSMSNGAFGGSYGGWSFDPWFGMYTFVPLSGMMFSPFGYPFWSPWDVGYAAPYYYGGGGYAYLPTRSGITTTRVNGGLTAVPSRGGAFGGRSFGGSTLNTGAISSGSLGGGGGAAMRGGLGGGGAAVSSGAMGGGARGGGAHR